VARVKLPIVKDGSVKAWEELCNPGMGDNIIDPEITLGLDQEWGDDSVVT